MFLLYIGFLESRVVSCSFEQIRFVMSLGLLPREGLYIDPIVSLARKTILHPIITLPISASYVYFCSGSSASNTPCQAKIVATAAIAALSLTLWINDFLTLGSRNNWVSDHSWDWTREVVVVTGGSGGIGGSVAQRLAGDGVRVVVVDIIPPTYSIDGKKVSYYRCDLSDEVEIRAVCEHIRVDIGHPTVLGMYMQMLLSISAPNRTMLIYISEQRWSLSW